MELSVYVDGKFYPQSEAKVSVFDHGLLYGDGVFEGIRAYNGRVFKLDRHLERLYHSAKAIDLKIPHTKEEMANIILETCRRNDIHEGYIRPVITRGKGDLGLDPRKCKSGPSVVVIAQPGISLYGKVYERGLKVVTSSYRRVPPQSLPTIGDRLSEARVSWVWYSGGWNDALAGNPDRLFQFRHQPLAYFR